MQIGCHNEFTIFGRILYGNKKVRVNNHNAIELCILCPNDDDYSKEPNRVYVNVITNDSKMFKYMKGRVIGITGHIITQYGQKLIADVISFPNAI